MLSCAELQVPWRALRSRPVVIELADVQVCAAPREEADWEEGPARRRALAAKQAQLAAAELERLAKVGPQVTFCSLASHMLMQGKPWSSVMQAWLLAARPRRLARHCMQCTYMCASVYAAHADMQMHPSLQQPRTGHRIATADDSVSACCDMFPLQSAVFHHHCQCACMCRAVFRAPWPAMSVRCEKM